MIEFSIVGCAVEKRSGAASEATRMSGRGHRGPIAPSDVPDRAASSLVRKAAAIGHCSNNAAVRVKFRVKVRVKEARMAAQDPTTHSFTRDVTERAQR